MLSIKSSFLANEGFLFACLAQTLNLSIEDKQPGLAGWLIQASNQRLTYIERPRGSPRAELLRLHLVWQDDTFLVLGWADTIKVAAIQVKDSIPADRPAPTSSTTGRKQTYNVGVKYIEIVAAIQIEYYISGLPPYGDALVILAYLPREKSGDMIESNPSRQVKEFSAHVATVNELSFDALGEYIGSCSDDGSVVVNSLYIDEKEKFDYHRPMKAVALDPEYAQNSSNRFADGGLAGRLVLNAKGWFGYREQVLNHGL